MSNTTAKETKLDENEYNSLKITLNFIRHGESCGNLASNYVGNIFSSGFVVNPPLSETGKAQANKLDFTAFDELDFIGCSQLIRAFETAANGMAYSIKRGRLYVLPFVNETRIMLNIDKVNEPNINKLKELANGKFKNWLANKNITPMFSIFDKVKNDNPNLNIDASSYDDFIKYVLPLIIKEVLTVEPNKKSIGIAIVSHGNFMADHFAKAHNLVFKKEIENTEIWTESFNLTKNGPIYFNINDCADKELAEKTCSKTAKQFKPKEKTNTIDKNFDYCFQKLKDHGNVSSANEYIYPLAFSSHLTKSTEGTKPTGTTKEETKKETNGEEMPSIRQTVENTLEKIGDTTVNAANKVKEETVVATSKVSEWFKDVASATRKSAERLGFVSSETPDTKKNDSEGIKQNVSDALETLGKKTNEWYDEAKKKISNATKKEVTKDATAQTGGNNDEKITDVNYEEKYRKYKKKY